MNIKRYLCCICRYYERKRTMEIYSTLNCIDEDIIGAEEEILSLV